MIKHELSENKIVTERLFLRPFKEKDFFDFLSLMADDGIGSYLPRGRGMTESEARKYFNEIMKDNIIEELGMMSIFKKEDDKYIGYCGIRKVPVTMELEIIYVLKNIYWGNGYCTEAVKAIIENGAKAVKFKKILGITKLENKRSIEVLKKLDFSDLGIKEIFGEKCRYFEKII